MGAECSASSASSEVDFSSAGVPDDCAVFSCWDVASVSYAEGPRMSMTGSGKGKVWGDCRTAERMSMKGASKGFGLGSLTT